MAMSPMIVMICVAIALWAVAGAMNVFARRLDDQVRRHQLAINVVELHERFKDAVAFEPADEVNVDVFPINPIETQTGNEDDLRQAA